MVHPINGSLAAPLAGTAAHATPESSPTDVRPGQTPVDAPELIEDTAGRKPPGDALVQANEQLQAWSTGMRFSMDEDAQRLVVSIVDSGTGEVLRTVPSDAVLRIARMIVQFQGASVDTRV